MRKLFSVLSFIFTFSAYGNFLADNVPIQSGDVVAGSGSTGGGFTVRCSANEFESESVQLLDLYEAKSKFGFELVNSTGDPIRDYYHSADRTYTLQGHPHAGKLYEKDIIENFHKFMRVVEFVDSEKDLPYVDDVGELPWIPSGCELKQVALFVDHPQKVFILKPLWDKMSSLDKAALISHELAGHWYRELGEKTTEHARSFVSHIYAKNPGPSLWQGLQGETGTEHSKSAFGETPKGFQLISSFYLDQKFEKITRFQFTQLFGRPMMVKTFVDIPKIEWNLELKFNSSGDDYTCVYASKGTNLFGTIAIRGTMGLGYQFQYKIKTGEPIELALIRNNLVIARNTIKSCH